MRFMPLVSFCKIFSRGIEREQKKYETDQLQQLHLFCHKQLVYKQLALRCQIATQLSELKRLSLSNNKNYVLKKMIFFLCCNKRKIATKLTIHQNSAVSKALLG